MLKTNILFINETLLLVLILIVLIDKLDKFATTSHCTFIIPQVKLEFLKRSNFMPLLLQNCFFFIKVLVYLAEND